MGVDNPHDSDTNGHFSFSRRSALALMGLGASTAIAGCSDNTDTTSGGNSETPNQPDGTTEEADQTDGHSLSEVLPGEKFGRTTISEFEHTLQFSGTRESSWMVRPFRQDVQPESTTYEKVGSEINYGIIPFPPGKIPILRFNGHIDGRDGVETSLRVSIANLPAFEINGEPTHLKEGPVQDTVMEVSAKGSSQVYNEVYLTEVEDLVLGLDNGHELPANTFLFEAKTDSPGNGAIRNSSTLTLQMEAL